MLRLDVLPADLQAVIHRIPSANLVATQALLYAVLYVLT
jgi:hypothetical protein